MNTHTCLRRGLDVRCSHGSWSDRHPVATALVAVITLLVVATTPWLLIVLAVAALAYVMHRENLRRRALATRADWRNARLMSTPAPRPKLFDEPIRRRARGADHWSTTRPIRIGRN